MTDSLSITVNAFARRVLMSVSVDESSPTYLLHALSTGAVIYADCISAEE